MKVLLSWLQEFAPGITGDPDEIGEHFGNLGTPVEEVEIIGAGLDGVVVAEVLGLRPHPEADRIQLVDVGIGDGEPLQVCCGAFNMAVGDHIPFATIGTVMPNGMEIARRKMRGEWSNGMCCSSEEIGFGEDSDGIMVLDPSTELGVPIHRALGMDHDVLWDLEVNPNRPDAMSVAGLARDLAARMGVPFTLEPATVAESGTDATTRATVEIIDKDLCGRFVGRILTDVKIGPSPQWMANRLRALGMRPINNVVDASNYVMLELGQPNHTYDLAKVEGATLRIRRAAAGEEIETLDGVTRTLTPEDGVIADGGDNAIGVAAVMGGASTEISETTTDVLLELAWWDPPSVARTSRSLNLRSEASARFERGVDTEIGQRAALRFAELLADSGAVLAPGVIDVRGNLPEPATVTLRTARVNAMLGTALSADDIAGHLRSIEFGVEPATTADGEVDDAASVDHIVTVPTFRPDTATEIDVIEEVARMFGYSNIERTLPSSPGTGRLTGIQQDRRLVRSTMVGLGLAEAMPVPFLAPGDLALAGLSDDDGIRVLNPLVSEESIMRSSLRPGLLKALKFNASHRHAEVALFEIGTAWGPVPDGASLPSEREMLCVVLAGREAPAAVEIWHTLASALAVKGRLVAAETDGLHPTRTAKIWAGGNAVGWVGEIDPDVVSSFEVPGRVAVLEVDLSTLLSGPHGERPYRKVSNYPSSDLDLAFVVADSVPAADVERSLRKAGGDLVGSVELFDVYRGDSVAAGSRSLAYTLRIQAADRTLTDDDLAQVQERAIAGVAADVGGSLRA